MNIIVTYMSVVTCFPGDFFGEKDIEWESLAEELKADIEKIIETAEFVEQIEWDLYIRAAFINAREVLVSKNRLGSFPSLKRKEITIVIPIPYIEVVSWGVEKKQHLYDINHYDNLMKNLSPLGVNNSAFTNRTDYIRDSLRRGVRHSFNEGFTINKVKVKLNSSQITLLGQ